MFIVEKLKSLLQLQWLQPFRQPSVWLPSVLLPLFALGLWSYLEHPEWIEGTIEENASTGEAVTTDPNSPVTEADLALEDLSAVAQADSVSSILQQVNLEPQEATANSEEQPQGENAETQGISESAQQDSKAAAKETNRKPNVEANNPFASAIQTFLNGGSTNRSADAGGPLGFSPIFPAFGAAQNPAGNNALQQALLELNSPDSETTSTSETSPLLPLDSTSQAVNSLNPVRAGQTSSLVGQVGQASSSSLAGPTPYIPGQIPYILPGQTTSSQTTAPGFITPTPGGSPYYPNQRGTGGYQVTPGGTTYSRQRGSTGSVVTPQGILAPRQRGGTGSVVTPQGTVYTRQRGSTGFTAPTVSPATPTSPSNTFGQQGLNSGTTTTPNNFQSNPFGNSTQFNNQNNSNSTAP